MGKSIDHVREFEPVEGTVPDAVRPHAGAAPADGREKLT